MHIKYDFCLFYDGQDYSITAGIEQDTDGSGRPLISVEIEDSEEASILERKVGPSRMRDMIVDAYMEMGFDDPRD